MVNLTQEEMINVRAGRSKFIHLAGAYFLGVFNDNFFKQAALLIAVALGDASFQGTATVLFALPFILFAAPAGWLADRFSKRDVAFYCKVLEVIAMLAGGYGIFTLQLPYILIMLFIMAAQSAFFSPALNGSIPELYPVNYVTKANSIVKLISTSAILLGIFFAGKVMDIKSSDQKVNTFLTTNSILKPERFLEKINSQKTDFDKFLSSNIKVENNIKDKDLLKQEILSQLTSLSESDQTKEFFDLDEKISIENQKIYFREKITRAYNLEIQYQILWNLGLTIISISVIVIAILGVVFGFFIKKFPAASPQKPFPWLGPIDTLKNALPKVYKDYLLRLTFLGYFFFYMIASLLTLVINQLGLTELGLSFSMTSYLVLALLVGICVGSVLAGVKLSGRDWYTKMPHALGLMGLFLAVFYFLEFLPDTYQPIFAYFLFFMAGIGGGLFIIPSESFQQIRPKPEDKGEVIGAGNFVVFVGVLLSGFLFNYIIVDFEVKPSIGIAWMGVFTLAISALAFISIQKVNQSERE